MTMLLIAGTVLLALVVLVAVTGVKRAVLAVLDLYKNGVRLYLAARGLTPADACERRVVSGQVWDEFCDTLKAAGAVVMAPGAPRTPFDQAEGYRYLARLVRGGLENFLEAADPQAPKFVSIANGLRNAPVKLGSDNPDNLYENATIDGRLTYRITATRGTVNHIGFGTQAGSYGKPGGLKTIDFKEIDELTINADGTFELIVGPERPPNCVNYMRTVREPPQGLLILRQTFGQRDKEEPAKCKLEVVDGPNVPSPLTCERLEQGLSSTGLFVGGATAMFAKWARDFQKHSNQLPLFDQALSNSVGGDPNIRYFHSHWALAEDEALVITASPPDCQTWNFQVNNYWMESLDYRYHPIHVNKYTAAYRHDGSVCIVLSHFKPESNSQLYNWLTTDGHTSGTMCFRWIVPQCAEDELPHPATRVVKLNKVASIV